MALWSEPLPMWFVPAWRSSTATSSPSCSSSSKWALSLEEDTMLISSFHPTELDFPSWSAASLSPRAICSFRIRCSRGIDEGPPWMKELTVSIRNKAHCTSLPNGQKLFRMPQTSGFRCRKQLQAGWESTPYAIVISVGSG